MTLLKNWIALSACASAALAAPYSTPPKQHDGHGHGHGHGNGGYGEPTVTIKNGTLEGRYSPEYDQDFFLGVPYAQPPVGPLRFRTPQSLNATWDAPLSVKEYSAACYGYGSDQYPYQDNLSEDCLYLNVVRPTGYEGETLPVAYWIHGGGLRQGAGIDQRYNLSFIVQRSVDIGKPIVGVSINYRLSLWGFPNGQEVVDSGNANLGFRDQRLGLHWVQENIEAFGGDPHKVTIFGESAGALSVGMHLTAYGGRDDGLFRGAIMQSGNPVGYRTLNYNTNAFQNASAQLGCGDAPSKLECLRTLDANVIDSWINSTAGLSFAWNPIIDGDFIQGKTSEQLASGAFVHVPIIDGANSDEGTAFGPKPMNSSHQFFTNLTQVANPVRLTPEQANKVMELYPHNITDGAIPANQPPSWTPPPSSGPESRRSDAYYGDLFFIAGRRKTCQAWATNDLPAFCYRFNTIPHGISPAIGATHFQEVAFVFNNQLGVGYGYPNVSRDPFEGMPQGYFDLAETMSASWVSFVSDLHPGEYWPQYTLGEDGVGDNWVFDANVTGLGYVERDDFRRAGIDLINSWDSEVFGR